MPKPSQHDEQRRDDRRSGSPASRRAAGTARAAAARERCSATASAEPERRSATSDPEHDLLRGDERGSSHSSARSSHSASAICDRGGGSSELVDAAERDVELPARRAGRTSSSGAERAAIAAAPPAPARAARRAPASVRRRGRGSVDGELGDDAAGARRQHDDAVGEHDRLLDVVRDEQRPCAARARARRRASPACRARVSASSAPNGSSRHSTGLPASSVRTKATRWRMPPDSSCGRASSKPSRPKRANSGRAAARASLARRAGDAQRAAPRCRARSATAAAGRAGASAPPASARDRPGVGRLQAADELEQRRLAAAAGPDDGDDLAGARRAGRRRRARHVAEPRRPRSSATAPAASRSGATLGALVGRIAPSAGITPQVRRVSAGAMGAISAGSPPAPLVCRSLDADAESRRRRGAPPCRARAP